MVKETELYQQAETTSDLPLAAKGILTVIKSGDFIIPGLGTAVSTFVAKVILVNPCRLQAPNSPKFSLLQKTMGYVGYYKTDSSGHKFYFLENGEQIADYTETKLEYDGFPMLTLKNYYLLSGLYNKVKETWEKINPVKGDNCPLRQQFCPTEFFSNRGTFQGVTKVFPGGIQVFMDSGNAGQRDSFETLRLLYGVPDGKPENLSNSIYLANVPSGAGTGATAPGTKGSSGIGSLAVGIAAIFGLRKLF